MPITPNTTGAPARSTSKLLTDGQSRKTGRTPSRKTSRSSGRK